MVRVCVYCFANAELQPGFELFARSIGEKLAEADIVITGEGGMDRQTVMGKGVGELAKLARQHDCRCLRWNGL